MGGGREAHALITFPSRSINLDFSIHGLGLFLEVDSRGSKRNLHVAGENGCRNLVLKNANLVRLSAMKKD
ncbi:unnamed protein product [Blepharisma stoltei]|uniref:Uncharacterized protein n=1 Tax=Blepharisma stoltei TaxID=1481888 RepID=A0AAU9KQ19_9CILI|nr:unnamed protein product [Blepharisma stoltei]